MSSTESGIPAASTETAEDCEECGRETVHAVTVELRAENPDSTFSREPYRVSECTVCETETTTRMNDV
ncbi:hypothetical protein [Halorussus aquaticus]|uniref:DUF7835 domain-containing protein n=1 Tax=Halorussus aquaticus TaxID=2953748 RepID=A0ABD5PYH4_9EURY|nr:hypothetical protein [Halorussus aquaticus]